ncbi:MAG: hypothetical protein JO033_01410 [Acidobacteriaceae bacterium]|nr:hypothetical protein [Acidobacteriaceae bacterium]MBV9972764.1 hypothetical protein [Candidatus Eremiobacteraeota bacterium]
MDVPSYYFLGFAALVALAINLSSAPQWRRCLLLATNIAFIVTFTHSAAELMPFAGLLLLGYAAVKAMERWPHRALFIVFLITLIFAFCWLKRYSFIPAALWLAHPYFLVGMSYVFFRILHLVIDAYQDALPDRVGLLSYVNYTLNFTALVSGPIQLYRDYLRTESQEPAVLSASAMGEALIRIIAGLFKITIVSPLLYLAEQRCLQNLPLLAVPFERAFDAALMLAIFPVYIYFNFSGYMDAVIGVARFLRLELPENFNRPFLSKGFIEFWSRWHMTLSHWIKTYVYSPLLLALMRRFPVRSLEQWFGVFAYFVAFFLIGVWHGRTPSFIVLGILFGLGVSINKLYQIAMIGGLGRGPYTRLCENQAYGALSRGLTFGWFAVASLFFWATLPQVSHFAKVLGALELMTTLLMVVVGAAALLSALEAIETFFGRMQTRLVIWGYVRTAWYSALAALSVSAAIALNAPAPHIIYRAF